MSEHCYNKECTNHEIKMKIVRVEMQNVTYISVDEGIKISNIYQSSQIENRLETNWQIPAYQAS